MTTSDVTSLLIGVALDPADVGLRTIAADALEDAERESEATLLRSLGPIRLLDGTVRDWSAPSLADYREAITEQMVLLGAVDGGTDGPVVYTDDDLPFGWCRISDDYVNTYYGECADVLEALEGAVSDGDLTADDYDAHEKLWNALRGAFQDDEPMLDLAAGPASSTVDVGPPEGEFEIFPVCLNAKTVWYFAPDDNEWRSANRRTDYSGEYDTEDEAREALLGLDLGSE